MNEKKSFMEILKSAGAGLLVWVLRTAIWRILVKILEKADTGEIADKVKPHMKNLFNSLGPEAQKAMTIAIKSIADFCNELLEDETVGKKVD